MEDLLYFFRNHAVFRLKLLNDLLQPNEAHDLHRRFSFPTAIIVAQSGGLINVDLQEPQVRA